MSTFLLYTFLLICLGIFIRIFWIPLMVVGAILTTALGIVISAGVTAIILEAIHALTTNGIWTGFETYFKYSLVFYTVLMFIYSAIVHDLAKIAINFFKK